MTEQRRRRGRQPGTVIDTPRKRWRAREAAIEEAGLRLCEQLLEFASLWPLRRDARPTAEECTSQTMDLLLKTPIDLHRMTTIEDVGRALDDVVAAVADGKLSPREGVLISRIIEARRKAFESIDFKQQLDTLSREVARDRNSKP